MKQQDEKSDLHIAAQPKSLEKNSVQLIMAMDIAGHGTNDIAEQLGMSVSRVSIVKNSQLYIEERRKRFESLQGKVVDGTASKILDDPARKLLIDAKLEAAEGKIELMRKAKSEVVKSAAQSEILGFAGILPAKHNESKNTTTIVMEEKLAKRFGFAKGYVEEVTTKTTMVKNEQPTGQ